MTDTTPTIYRTDVPMPPNRGGSRHDPKSIRAKIEACPVGASFFLPGKKVQSLSANREIARKNGIVVHFRTMTEGGVTGVGVWRTE